MKYPHLENQRKLMIEELINLGFEHNTISKITDDLDYYIKTKFDKIRTITITDINTPNEMIFFKEGDSKKNDIDDDIVVLHNFDYDGYITIERIKALMYGLTGNDKFI